MAQFAGMVLTNNGLALQAKAEAGTTLTFTKVKIGDGQLGTGQTLETLTDLIHPLENLPIASVSASGGLCTITATITNVGITQGFYVREVGLYATDPQLGEILYAVTNATVADYLPPNSATTVVNNQFDIVVVVGNATSITASISPSGLVTQDQFNTLESTVNTHETVIASQTQLGHVKIGSGISVQIDGTISAQQFNPLVSPFI
ncbi:phage tail protein [Desulfosporosinus sp. FKA]|uniref:phage tail-collar fiber domain-containing protein n=1 Tax=Desulfosporosinus sp. FKA TaxID=1969834 RepID=UPI000B49B075|nr:phage tail protein [Desulfosporosinus sp. FKA]